MAKTSKETKTAALFTVSIDGTDSAPMSLADALAAAAEHVADGAEATVHHYLSGDLYEPVAAPSPIKAAKAPRKPAKAQMPAKAADDATDTVPPAQADAAPATMADRVLELAARKQGASAVELNELTSWKGAPWKWLFSNPKGTGWCDRRGLAFEVRKVDGDKPETRYFVLG